MKKRSGFTLIELLIVIGIIAILAGIVIIAVNPTKQFGQANDAQRQSDVNAILNAIGQYSTAHRGALPDGIAVPTLATDTNVYAISLSAPTTLPTNITAIDGATGSGFCADLVTDHLSAMPVDPDPEDDTLIFEDCNGTLSDYHTGYYISVASDGRLTVLAPNAEQYDDNDADTDVGDAISVTR